MREMIKTTQTQEIQLLSNAVPQSGLDKQSCTGILLRVFTANFQCALLQTLDGHRYRKLVKLERCCVAQKCLYSGKYTGFKFYGELTLRIKGPSPAHFHVSPTFPSRLPHSSMRSSFSLFLLLGAAAAQTPIQWTFVQNGMSGIVPLELITISDTLMLMMDRADGNPLLLPTGEPSWAALWHLNNHTATPLRTITDTFFNQGGSFLSNGTLVAIGGQALETPGQPPADGRMGIRLFGPCTEPTGAGCTIFEDTEHLHLVVTRWYPTGLRIPDGSLMIIGGSDQLTLFNTVNVAENSIEFFPSRKNEEGTVRPSQFLNDSNPANLFPRSFVLPSGHVFVVASNISMIYDIDTDTELMRLPEIPNNVHIGPPYDGTAQLLPLSPPLYEPAVLVCGGSNVSITLTAAQLSIHDPATKQCSRITLTPAGVAAGWELEEMPEERIIMETVMLPTGDVILINGAHTGYSGYPSVGDANATQSNSVDPATRGMVYRSGLPAGQRITQDGMPTSAIPRMYHSAAALTAQGNIMVAGSNPHPSVVEPPTNFSFPTEFRVEYLNPDFITNNAPRPVIQSAPKQIQFNQKVALRVDIPPTLLHSGELQVSIIDMGYVTHGQHGNSRLVFLEHTLSGNTLEITTPPNNNIYPPGPAWLFVVANGVWSEGVQMMIGNGESPPVVDQGVPLQLSSL